jgi:hypothetical protein
VSHTVVSVAAIVVFSLRGLCCYTPFDMATIFTGCVFSVTYSYLAKALQVFSVTGTECVHCEVWAEA